MLLLCQIFMSYSEVNLEEAFANCCFRNERIAKRAGFRKISFTEILILIASGGRVYVYFSRRLVFSLREVDNNLQIYSRQICSRRRARASWKARHRAASYFINYNEGYTAPLLNIHETPTPHLVYAPGTDRTFSRRRPV